ncbi:hypothetical protein PFTANZ_05454 [Plasmodium falciparum Tanzania (2000708)]|uniref:Uncharacterized protein n=1 Tax=Plasmodium falciparum Tanzania (2000708) TaxID=1036725 RepID=A0A024VZX6_PLAFA|nr:hypothetical protein PFTANZ_05454 [Plasmodium falciparum Tanzania (2000708)]
MCIFISTLHHQHTLLNYTKYICIYIFSS